MRRDRRGLVALLLVGLTVVAWSVAAARGSRSGDPPGLDRPPAPAPTSTTAGPTTSSTATTTASTSTAPVGP
jgi:hypothetical protein